MTRSWIWYLLLKRKPTVLQTTLLMDRLMDEVTELREQNFKQVKGVCIREGHQFRVIFF